jgi:hypothetical protein
MTQEQLIKDHFQRLVLPEFRAILHKKDYKHIIDKIDDMYILVRRLENETILDYSKGYYFRDIMKHLRNSIYYTILGLESNIDEND